jgi:dethiobiotin synthetase
MARGFYVTGTDTGVGKTLASACLVHALRARGLHVAGMKPVASGCVLDPAGGGWHNDDALALQAASSLPVPDYAWVNPVALPEATAPQLAAARAGVDVSLQPLLAASRALSSGRDAIVVEGVGGWLAPLADGLEQSTLARALGLPVVLVVGVRLGCLNHARLTERAIRADGLPLAGWIANAVDPEFHDAAEYLALLARTLQSPCLGSLPHAPDGRADAMAAFLVDLPAV